MESEYFQEYHSLERSHWWFLARLDILRSQVLRLSSNKELNILNVGVATGATTIMLSEFGPVTSVEFDSQCCEFLRDRLGLSVTQASVTDLPYPDESFDLVCAFDVIEHVEDDSKAVLELCRVCKKGGVILTTVPAFQALWSKHDVINHHVRRYDSKRYKSLFPKSGEVLFSSYFNTILFLPILVFRLLSKVVSTEKVREGSGSDFSIKLIHWANPILLRLFKTENVWLSNGISAPFGVSYILSWKKQSAS